MDTYVPLNGAGVAGAFVRSGGVEFCVHATRARRVEVMLGDRAVPLRAIDDCTFGEFVPDTGAGVRYRYRLDGGEPLPDPWSRWQPDGPHGASCVVDAAFEWTDSGWSGAGDGKQFIYELHVGTFTPERTWRAAAAQLDYLVATGVTAIELMPAAEFPGRFGWGYDGVQLFAPYHHYGSPDDLRAFVDRAHAVGLAVLLDVVYNHLGPDGNYMPQYVPEFLSTRHVTDWGPGLDYDGPGARIARSYVLDNVAYWIRDFHLDGLRLDATQDVRDTSRPHVLAEITRVAREAASGRRVLITAENEPQSAVLLRVSAAGGCGMDALWNDDFHHATRVAATGRREAYYSDYTGNAQELVSLAMRGWLFRGQRYEWQQGRRGMHAPDITPRALVAYLQNHDQIANSLTGERLHQLAAPGIVRALTAFLLLGPSHVLLFQGQEYGASQPFLFFADHAGDLGRRVALGRRQFLGQFRSIAATTGEVVLDDPRAERTMERSTLILAERKEGQHARWYALHRDLIELARTEPLLRDTMPVGAVLGGRTFVLRWEDGADARLLIVNLGRSMRRNSIAEPLLGPVDAHAWSVQWSSDDSHYGGPGVPEVETPTGWLIPSHAAVLLHPVPARRTDTSTAGRPATRTAWQENGGG